MPLEHTARWRSWLEALQAQRPGSGPKPQSLPIHEIAQPTVAVQDLAAMQTPQARWEKYNLVGTPGFHATIELLCRRNTLVDEIWCHIDEAGFPGNESFRMWITTEANSYAVQWPFSVVYPTFVSNPDHFDETTPTFPGRVSNVCIAMAGGAVLLAGQGTTFHCPMGPNAVGAPVPWSGGRWYFRPPIYVPAGNAVRLVQDIEDRPFPLVGIAWRELPTA